MSSNTQPPSVLRRSPRIWPWALALVVVGSVGTAAWLWSEQKPSAESVATESTPEEPTPTAAPPVPELEPLPPETKEATARGRDHLAEASRHPAYRKWLGESELLSRLVAATLRVAEGESPRELLGFLAPGGRFEVVERGDKLVIAPASFARYDEIAAAIASIDAGAAATAYRALKPALTRLHREIAPPGATLDDTVRRALTRVIEAPVPKGEIEVVSAKVGANYELADAALEALPDAEKHLLRMGPENAGRVKAKARALLDELRPSTQAAR